MKFNFENKSDKEEVKTLPIKVVENKKSFTDINNINIILKYINKIDKNESRTEFHLMTKIKDVNYFFELIETSIKSKYFLSFNTDYEYSRVSLNQKEINNLFFILNILCESVYEYLGDNINKIGAISSDVGYPLDEVDKCIEDILKSGIGKHKDEILKLGPDKIFLLYKKLYGKVFEYTKGDKKYSDLRDRFFIINLKKHLKNWNIEKSSDKAEIEIILTRKKNNI